MESSTLITTCFLGTIVHCGGTAMYIAYGIVRRWNHTSITLLLLAISISRIQVNKFRFLLFVPLLVPCLLFSFLPNLLDSQAEWLTKNAEEQITNLRAQVYTKYLLVESGFPLNQTKRYKLSSSFICNTSLGDCESSSAAGVKLCPFCLRLLHPIKAFIGSTLRMSKLPFQYPILLPKCNPLISIKTRLVSAMEMQLQACFLPIPSPVGLPF